MLISKTPRIFEEGLNDSLAFYRLEGVDQRKISSVNMLAWFQPGSFLKSAKQLIACLNISPL